MVLLYGVIITNNQESGTFKFETINVNKYLLTRFLLRANPKSFLLVLLIEIDQTNDFRQIGF